MAVEPGGSQELLRHANDIIGQVLLVAFFVIMGAVPLAVIVLGVVNFVRAFIRRGTIALQILASLAIWFFLTYAVVIIFMVIAYPLSQANELKSTAVVIVACLIYTLVGAALIYWTKRQAKLSQAAKAA